jgi:hypothetical protein
MKFRASPGIVIAAICSVLIPAAAGLTAPIWLALRGLPLKVANEVGTNIFGATSVVLAVFLLLFWFVVRPRLDYSPVVIADETDAERERAEVTKGRLVHAVFMLLFVLPFVLVLISVILGQMEKV